ncbi:MULTISPECIES: FecR family protein [Sphingobacterium]|uniref:FecR family protein n=1 Tax=Sphingobacterium populi TaxID=1812824 RepID=A0ABW5UDM6_9SPHI|nr:FecR family protein [Sphingobacterium sp. CFCC 11742]
MTTKYRIIELLRKERNNALTVDEQQELTNWLSIPQNASLYQQIKNNLSENEALDRLKAYDTETELARMLASLTPQQPKKSTYAIWLKFVAVSAACIAIAYVLITPLQQSKDEVSTTITAGTDRALLTLEDGTTVDLSTLEARLNDPSAAMRVYEDAQGRPVYEYTGSEENAQGWHTISTPKGGQYTVKLPDGSTIWLNAESKLRYPLNFLANRKVFLEGEGYFDIRKMPNDKGDLARFTVELPGHQVNVLGTQFNINAYKENTHAQTTLIEGKVHISVENETRELRPGQQAMVSATQPNSIEIRKVDTRSFADWKEGYFFFDALSIEEVMQKIAKWYDIQVVYSGAIPNDKFGGEISRFENLNEILDLLELTEKVHFKVEGRRVTVMP